MNKIKVLLAALAAFVTVSATAQTNQVPNQLPPLPAGIEPSGVTLPAFNTNGLSFTNASYKVAIGSEFNAGGGVLTYMQADADLFKLSSFDIGFGANGTLSGTGTGLHNAGGFVEALKNFNNFQFAVKAGGGILIDSPSVGYGSEVFELNYNLSQITSGFLAGNLLFTYVGANLELQEGHFGAGNDFEKQFHIFAGLRF